MRKSQTGGKARRKSSDSVPQYMVRTESYSSKLGLKHKKEPTRAFLESSKKKSLKKTRNDLAATF
jgi:hypothetical protein